MANRLADQTSPYLLQHADNPVDWYPWGKEALKTARQEDKPILLSVGYSACHWCHVMAHESFEDETVARLMNSLFVNIKVDREERPDLDKIYQLAHQLMTQRAGGWPLTMFLSPHNHVPFFGGTYFPKEARFGMMAFPEILERVAAFYRDNRDQVEAQNRSMSEALERIAEGYPGAGAGELDATAFLTARRQAERSFDERHGGFGRAPKFPHPTSLELLLRDWASARLAGEDLPGSLAMLELTLERMALGGINDQLGGGFCRYSVDDHWMIPHFEKMLYDNGPLLALYAQLWAITGKPLYRRTAEDTAAWVMREMQAPEGGYYSSLDADSEGEEGKYYTWEKEEVAELTGEDYPLLAAYYGLDRPPNFEGKYHLHVFKDLDRLAEELDLGTDQTRERLDTARTKLLAARAQRTPPGRDDKVLTSWNALMIRGMAIAGRHLGCEEYLDSAAQALEFIRRELWRDGRLLATYKDGRAHLGAYLDDHAFLIDAILELLQGRWHSEWLDFARELAEVLIGHFEDTDQGGFFFTADDHEQLLQRLKPLADEATPSGNGIACLALARLGHLLADTKLLDTAERGLRAGASALREAPYAHASLLFALDEHLRSPQIVIIRGAPEQSARWLRIGARPYSPRRLSFAIPTQANGLPASLEDKAARDGIAAYVCEGMTCSAPIQSLEALEEQLAGSALHAAKG
jgi:uncharacterized protein YyaL (SSP411 family)